MKICVPKENKERENRVALTPSVVKQLTTAGYEVCVESGAGLKSYFDDASYQEAGASILADTQKIYADADVILKVNAPIAAEIASMKKEAVLISFMWAATNPALVESCANAGISAFSMDAVPRISRAQKMDALSSQANLAGYKAVIDSVYEYNKAVPMMMTAAGTITPAKFFIIGAGVAGLQAIATAKRLGGVVSATDVRLASKEQVESLGGKFIFAESSKNLETSGGYAKELDEEDKKKQEELLKNTIKNQDIVICTALIPGKKAPRIVTDEMVKSMKSGSVICDLAVEQGGNSAFSEPGKIVVINGVKIIGHKNFPSRISESASILFAKNVLNFLEIIYDKVEKKLKIDENDEIIKAVYINKEIS